MKAVEIREIIKQHEQRCVAIGQSLSSGELKMMAQTTFPAGTLPDESSPIEFTSQELEIFRHFVLENNRSREAMGEIRDATSIPWQVASIERVQSMEGKRVHNLARSGNPAEVVSKIDHPTKTINLVDTLTKLLRRPDDPAAEARRYAGESYLRDYVFRGLDDLKPAYDSPLIQHFRAPDFLRVIARCNLLGVHIHGVEVFGPRAEFVEVEIGEGGSHDWCVALVHR